MSPLLALLVVQTPATPIDHLVGKWTSLETVEERGQKRTLRLKGTNRWIYKGKLLEISEEYQIDGEKEKGENHILLRIDGEKVSGWWHVPSSPTPIKFAGGLDPNGMTLTSDDNRLRIVYIWDGKNAYDAKLLLYSKEEQAWKDRTIARYTRRR